MSMIAEKRRQMGMTQAELAERIGVRQETMCRIERGLQSPSYQAAQRIAVELGEAGSFEPEKGSHARFFDNANMSKAFKLMNISAVKTFLGNAGIAVDVKNLFIGGEAQ